MGKRIKDYVKYTINELENYTKLKKSCVKKINRELHLNFPPYGLGGNFKKTLIHILSERKIGSYDSELKGIILDIKNIKVFEQYGAIRFDDPTIHFNLKADCYVFQPEVGAVVSGVVKHISSRQIGVIIYRVFNVTIRLKDWTDLELIEYNSEIEFRIKKFDFHNMMPYIEGELVAKEMPLLGSSNSNLIYLRDSDDSESSSDDDDENIISNKKLIARAISDENEEKPNEVFKVPKAPKRRSITTKVPIADEDDDEEIVFSEIFHLKKEEVEKIENGKKRKLSTKSIDMEVITNGSTTKTSKIKKTPVKNKILSKFSETNSDISSNEDKPVKKNKNKKKTLEKGQLSDTDSAEQSLSQSPIKSLMGNSNINSTIKREIETPGKDIKMEVFLTPQRPTSGYETDSDVSIQKIKLEPSIKTEQSATKKSKAKNKNNSPDKKFKKFSDNFITNSNGAISETSIDSNKTEKSGFKKIHDAETVIEFSKSPEKPRKRKISTASDSTTKKSKLNNSSNDKKIKAENSPSKFKIKLEF